MFLVLLYAVYTENYVLTTKTLIKYQHYYSKMLNLYKVIKI